ncbi:DUF4192 domain-containing protein [Quadrisphaera setariae]|uniref:DUF4192 domain-containing protein n=1 Tax=Quadrisphaera setariae TaxID=2593304 RepID=UPI00164F8E94|nr:DUF4192 domain-containing protein [Quadrisphaera setariae]
MEPAQQPGRSVIRSSSPFEVLALAESTLGFRPRESLLVVGLRGPRWRTGLVARVDVAAADEPEVVGSLVHHLLADGAGRCFVALVTDAGGAPVERGRRRLTLVPPPRGPQDEDAHPAGPRGLLGLPGADRAERVCAALVAAGIEPEPWLVHRGRLYSYSCDLSCCPRDGLPLDRVASTRVAAEAVLAGRVVTADREGWERGLRRAVAAAGTGGAGGPGGPGGPHEPDEAGDAAVASALAGLDRRRRPASPDVRRTWRRVLAAEEAAPGAVLRLDAADAALLLDGLTRLPLRDHLLAAAVPQALPELARSGTPLVDPGAALAVLQQLARRAPLRWRAAATGCAAYVAWCTGAAPAAGVWAEAALELDPEHSLSALVLQAVSIGMPPPGRERATGAGGPGHR